MSKEQGFEVLTRVGFVARGILYLAIGTLVLFLGRAEGADGALKFLSAGIGRWLLVAMATGFAGYGLWRLADAALGTEHPGDGRKAWAKRAGAGVSGLVHLFLAWQTARLALGVSAPAENAGDKAATVLHLPAGQVLLGAVALGFAVAGIVQVVKATSCSFLRKLVPEARHSAVKWLGRLGYFARGGVFLAVAWFLITAAVEAQSSEAGGLQQVFAWLSRPLSLALAAGLFLFGVFGLLEAWYRRIRTPDIDAVARQASDTVAAQVQ